MRFPLPLARRGPGNLSTSYRPNQFVDSDRQQMKSSVTSASPHTPQRPSFASKIRFVCNRDAVVEQVLIVLGAHLFEHGLLHAAVLPRGRPWLIEGIRIIDRIGDF